MVVFPTTSLGGSWEAPGREGRHEKSRLRPSGVWNLSATPYGFEHVFEILEAPAAAFPREIGDVIPGPELARLLGSVDRDLLSDFDRVELLTARSRLRSHVEAELLADMVAVLDAETRALSSGLAVDEVHEAAAAEIQAALSWTRRMAERQLDFASTPISDYPKVWEMLHGGLLDLPWARVIVDHTCHLEAEVRDQVVETVLEKASSQTTGLLAARIGDWPSG